MALSRTQILLNAEVNGGATQSNAEASTILCVTLRFLSVPLRLNKINDGDGDARRGGDGGDELEQQLIED